MASPLRWFRKHSFFFIVVFGVFLMAIFGLGSVITGLNPSSMARQAQAENKTVAEWSGGEIKKFDLASLRQRHFASLRFLQNVYKYAVEQNGGNSFPVAVEEIMPIVRGGENPSVEQMDERILNRYLFAKCAEQEGFIVDENMVYEYIAQYGGDTLVNKNLLKQLNRQVNQNLPLTAIVRHLQTELLWQQMESMTRGGIPFDSNRVAITAIAPTEAMELYARTAKKMECVVLPIAVDLDAVTEEPSESEMKKLYEEGKYDYPMYNFDTPGFKELKKTKIQYFVADMKTFLDNEIAKLTDEEIVAEYDRLVEAEDRSVMEVVPLEDENSDGENNASDAENSEDDPAPAPGSGEESSSEEGSNENNGDESDDQEPADTDSGEQEQTADDENSEDSEESTSEETEGGYTSIRFQDEEPSEESETQETESQDTESQVTESQDTESQDTESQDAESSNPVEKESENSTNDSEQESDDSENSEKTDDEAESSDEDQEDTSSDDQADPVIADDPKTKLVAKPLQDVADVIKRKLKIEDARKARDEALENAEKVVTFYQRDLSTYEMNVAAGKEDIAEPEEPNFQEIANKNGIQFFETGLINEIQISDEEIGKVVDISIGPNGQAMQINIGDQIFQQFESLPEYQAMVANDFMKNAKYLYWLADKVEQRVPEYEDAKEAIIKYWKWNKAVENAMAKAQQTVDKINNGENILLNEEFPEKAKLTGQFTWFSSFGRFAYGTPEGVTDPGEDFMKEAYGLKRNKAGMALNETRDTVYVIQNIAPLETTYDEMADDYLDKNFFLTKQVPREVVSAKSLYRQRLNYEWLRQFREDMEVKVIGQ